MARVRLLDPERAEGRPREVFDRVRSYYKMVPALQRALNYLPEVTDALWTLSLNTVREGSIPEELKRVFFAVAAYEVECGYCTAAHMLALMGKNWTQQECRALLEGKPSPRLSEKENAAVEFARAVAQRPAAVPEALVERVRACGWTDAEIVEIVASVALMRYTSTVASALEIPLESAMEGVACAIPARG